MENLNYKACGTCAHGTSTPKDNKTYCRIWGCHFIKAGWNCDYYHHEHEPVYANTKKQTPTERELDLMHLRRYCAFEHMNENEVWGFLEWHKEFYKDLLNNF